MGRAPATEFCVAHVSPGDLLCRQVERGKPVGELVAAHQKRGGLVPDTTVLDVLAPMIIYYRSRDVLAVDTNRPPRAVTTEVHNACPAWA